MSLSQLFGSAKLDATLGALFSKGAGMATMPKVTALTAEEAKATSPGKASAAPEKGVEEGRGKRKRKVDADIVAASAKRESAPASAPSPSVAMDIGARDSDADSDESEEDTKSSKSKLRKKVADDPEKSARTVFVGNLSKDVLTKANYKLFKKTFEAHGKIESIRFRSLALAEPMARRLAFIHRRIHPSVATLHAYVVYESPSAVETAIKALNATTLFDCHLRVDTITVDMSTEARKRSVFVGNLAFDVSDETLWLHFGQVAPVKNVRVVRDGRGGSGMGKGIAFVEFEDKDAVALAMRLDGAEMGGRKLRVTRAKVMQPPKLAASATPSRGTTAASGPKVKKPRTYREPKAGADKTGGPVVIEGERATPAAIVELKARKKKARPGRDRSIKWKQGGGAKKSS